MALKIARGLAGCTARLMSRLMSRFMSRLPSRLRAGPPLRALLPMAGLLVTLGALAPGFGQQGPEQQGPGPDSPRMHWDAYKNEATPPSVDQHLTDPALNGAIDLHAHSDPDSYPRQWDAFDVAKLATERGMRGIVLKNHWTETAGLAYLVRKYGPPGLEVFGGLSLDTPTGGINPAAVRYFADAAGHYGRIVWMPTHDSEHEVTYNKENRPIVRVSQQGRLLPEVGEVLSLIAQHDLTLATGHVTPEEALMIIRAARQTGVSRIIVTHPLLSPQNTYMSFDQLREAADLGAYIEIVATNFTRPPPGERARVIDAIRMIGPGRIVVSSDSGLVGTLNHGDALATAAKMLREAGFDEAALNLMFKENPARLVKLPPA